MKRKLLSVILSFLFVFSMAISVSASADGIEDGSTTISPRHMMSKPSENSSTHKR